MRGCVALVLAVLGAPAFAQSIGVGDALRCPSEGGLPPVIAWVGRTERWSDLGATGPGADAILVHLQLRAEGGGRAEFAAHAPFEAAALAGCAVVPGGVTGFDRAAFNGGYDTWREAVPDGAGAFTIGPAEALWIALGVRDGVLQ